MNPAPRAKTVTWLAPADDSAWFPPLEQALDEPNGLLAAGGDLSPRRVLAAYRRGIFPWYSPGQPVLWWSPDPREVLEPQRFHHNRSLAKAIRKRGLQITFDRAFEAVLDACAAPRRYSPGTWITAEMRAAYLELHRLGAAHSVETWRNGQLVGGVYGVLQGALFFGESMFSREPDGSKAALAGLARRAVTTGCALIDCQLASPHLRRLGSRSLPRREFIARLDELVQAPTATTFASA
ncbi:MAG TPA: leucyl/phenylalanyl-tRNA--protein transferase [Steroidobacteraceae bacterium]|mgnify:CR=1 FL=1|nr:leucyl/phenylalanyl-tRNA--protein transferase [Steroidobacteraceae bacterium]HRX88488.1 leucyl/phenylalanyl-tRNA--protein transferase [Steroidobacteraceae bacterium]